MAGTIYRTGGWLLAALLLTAYPLGIWPAGLTVGGSLADASLLLAGATIALVAWRLPTLSRATRVSLLVAACLVASAALWLPPALTGRTHLVAFPVAVLATLAGTCMLIGTRIEAPRWFLFLWALGVSLIAWQWLREDVAIEPVLMLLAHFVAPLALAALLHVEPRWWQRLQWLLPLLWLALTIKGVDQYLRGREVIGFAMNRNWMAGVMLALLPWTIHWLRRRDRLRPWQRHAAIAVTTLLTLVLVYACHSRAAWLGLAVYGIGAGILALPPRRRWPAVAGLVVAVALAALLLWPRLLTVHERDVRIPLWLGTIELIGDHAMIGIGPGNYATMQPTYLTHGTYYQRLVAAPVVEHPHNEALHLAATVGVLPALAWAVLMLVTIIWLPRLPERAHPARLGIIVLLVQGMLDKPLIQPPGNLLWWWLLAMVWCEWLRHVRPPSGWSRQPRRHLAMAVAVIIAAAYGLSLTTDTLRAGWHQRRAMQYEGAQHNQLALAALEKALRLRPASVELWYAHGVIAKGLGQHTTALHSLQRVYQLNPQYAHVNRMIGSIYLNTGKPREARTFLSYDAWLYPYNLNSLVPLYTVDATLDTRAAAAQARQIRHVAAFFAPRLITNPDERLATWLHALPGPPAPAIEAAIALLPRDQLRHSGADPALYTAFQANPWPGHLLFGDFTPAHARGWRATLLRHHLIQPLPDQPDQAIRQLTTHIAERFTIDPTASHPDPALAWQEARGKHQDGLAALAWMLDAIPQVQAILYLPPQHPEAWAIYAGIGPLARQWMRVQLDGTVSNLDHPDLPPDLAEQARLVIHPADFFLRNLILYAVVAGIDPQSPFAHVEWPTERLDRLRLLLPDLQRIDNPATLLYAPALTIFATSTPDDTAPLPPSP